MLKGIFCNLYLAMLLPNDKAPFYFYGYDEYFLFLFLWVHWIPTARLDCHQWRFPRHLHWPPKFHSTRQNRARDGRGPQIKKKLQILRSALEAMLKLNLHYNEFKAEITSELQAQQGRQLKQGCYRFKNSVAHNLQPPILLRMGTQNFAVCLFLIQRNYIILYYNPTQLEFQGFDGQEPHEIFEAKLYFEYHNIPENQLGIFPHGWSCSNLVPMDEGEKSATSFVWVWSRPLGEIWTLRIWWSSRCTLQTLTQTKSVRDYQSNSKLFVPRLLGSLNPF